MRAALHMTGVAEADTLPSRMTKVSDAFSFDDLCELTEEDMDHLLGFYASGEIPSLNELVAMRSIPDFSKTDIFDGSFGFSVGA